jgi:hypothetical protein
MNSCVSVITIIFQSYVQTFVNFKSFKVFKFVKGHNMFRAILP